MFTGPSCGTAAEAEDDDSTGADESPNGASVLGSTITGTAATLAGGTNLSLVFNTTVN